MSDKSPERRDLPIQQPRAPMTHPPAKPNDWQERQGKPRAPQTPPKPPLEKK